jgi:hypothetical protein
LLFVGSFGQRQAGLKGTQFGEMEEDFSSIFLSVKEEERSYRVEGEPV